MQSLQLIVLLKYWKIYIYLNWKPLGLAKWMTVPSSRIMFTSSMPGIGLTANFFSVPCNFLSSVVAVLWTTFFFRLCVPLTWFYLFSLQRNIQYKKESYKQDTNFYTKHIPFHQFWLHFAISLIFQDSLYVIYKNM